MKQRSFREKFDDAAGVVCKSLIPIKQEYYLGKGDKIAICTLSSLRLLEEISKTESLMSKIILAGRLLSENKGIDKIIEFSVIHPTIEVILLCGKEVKGHNAGQALISLQKNGIDGKGRIIGATAPYPLLDSGIRQIDTFRKRVKIVDKMGLVDVRAIDEFLSK